MHPSFGLRSVGAYDGARQRRDVVTVGPFITAWKVQLCSRSSFHFSYIQVGATAGCWGYGFIIGRPARFAIAGLMAGLGFTFGSFVMVQNTRGRLMGFRENLREQKQFGVEEIVESKLDWKSYT